jgi:superfamily II DNA or RNA helicase
LSQTATIANNAVTAKLIDADKQTKLITSTALSYKVSGSEHMAMFKSGTWDGRSSFFDYKTGTFPAGFVPLVHAALQKKGYQVRRVRNPLPSPLGKEEFWEIDGLGLDPMYDYQPEVVNKLLKYGQMIAQVATGGGKSRIARLAYARIKRPTLFLTTRGVLMYQMKEAVEGYGFNCGVIGDGELSATLDFNVAMVQTIIAHLKDPDGYATVEKQNFQAKRRLRMINYLEKIEFVILEEAHESSGNSYYDILRNCKNAHYRLALTATPFMKDDEEANMRLMACSGPIGIEVSEELLIERGILAKPYFKVVKLAEKPIKLYKSTPWQKAYTVGIVENEYRNLQIVKEVQVAAKCGLTTMILVQHTKHGKLLNEMLLGKGIKSDYIHGEHDQSERKEALRKLGSGELDALIGTSILDVGVDVPAIGVIILAGGGKAEVALRQRIGRGLRRKKKGKNVALIIDFYDEHNTHLRDHSRNRVNIIRNTPGFGENIMNEGFCFYKDLLLKK